MKNNKDRNSTYTTFQMWMRIHDVILIVLSTTDMYSVIVNFQNWVKGFYLPKQKKPKQRPTAKAIACRKFVDAFLGPNVVL